MNRIILLLALAVLPIALSRSSRGDSAALVVAVDPRVTDLEAREGEDFEAVFLSFMIDHHRAGIRKAALVADRASDAGLKTLAETMISRRRREIAELEKWLEQWYPRKPGPELIPQAVVEKERDALAGLEKAKGPDFDKLFRARMSEHHESGRQMNRLAAARAIHEEVKSHAAKAPERQEKEKEQLAE